MATRFVRVRTPAGLITTVTAQHAEADPDLRPIGGEAVRPDGRPVPPKQPVPLGGRFTPDAPSEGITTTEE